MKKIFVFFFLMVTAAAFAAEPAKPDNDLGLTDKDCQMLVDYQPSSDVDYKPGVDVHGKPVMEADLTPSVVKPPEKYTFDLNVDAAHYLGMTVPQGTQGLMKVGTISIDAKTGQATFNGQPMEGNAMSSLKAYCATHKPQGPPK